jgi:hypothetical protein
MADIQLDGLTNATDGNDGTGVFDKLMVAVENHIQEQYDDGRITGSDYATVYLGSLQSVLQQSMAFLLEEQKAGLEADLIQAKIDSEVKNNEAGGVIDLQKQKLQEEIDLVIAQTANQYQQIDASRQDTTRRNLINSKEAIKLDKETELLITQNTELGLNGVIERELKNQQAIATESGGLDNTNKTNAEVAFLNAREIETEASTVRNDAESAQKILLMSAQTTGFKTDAKQKLLKQMAEMRAVSVSISGSTAGEPDASLGPQIDAVVNDVLNDLDSGAGSAAHVVIP